MIRVILQHGYHPECQEVADYPTCPLVGDTVEVREQIRFRIGHTRAVVVSRLLLGNSDYPVLQVLSVEEIANSDNGKPPVFPIDPKPKEEIVGYIHWGSNVFYVLGSYPQESPGKYYRIKLRINGDWDNDKEVKDIIEKLAARTDPMYHTSFSPKQTHMGPPVILFKEAYPALDESGNLWITGIY